MASASPVFDKMNLKDQGEIVVLNAPDSFESELARLEGVIVKRSLKGVRQVSFTLAFVTRDAEVEALARSLPPLVDGDGLLWFAYPKASSKRYTSELKRDDGWKAFGAAGFETVRMIAIDEDWTAKRLRRAEFIKVMKRPTAYALSKTGKALTKKKR